MKESDYCLVRNLTYLHAGMSLFSKIVPETTTKADLYEIHRLLNLFEENMGKEVETEEDEDE